MSPEERRKIEQAPAGIIRNVEPYGGDWAGDQSNLPGWMESISFPRDEKDICDQLRDMARGGTLVTVQGMRTGISGGAVPQGGHVLSLNKMTRFLGLSHDGQDGFGLSCQAGVLMREQIWPATAKRQFDTTGWPEQSLDALRAFAAGGTTLFAPDPSEPTVSVGGMVACNASGARSYLYGATRRHVRRVRMVLADSSVIELCRGQARASGRNFSLTCRDGRTIAGPLPGYRMPAVKNAAGYFVADDMDLLDLLVGSEGTLGVISEVEVGLILAPPMMTGVMALLPSEASAFQLAGQARTWRFGPAVIEYFDHRCVEWMRERRDVFGPFQMGHEFPDAARYALYLEFHGQEGEVAGAIAAVRTAAETLGATPDDLWVESGPDAIANFKQIKHIFPEQVNGLIARRQETVPAIHKLGTDLAVPLDRLEALLARQRADLAQAGLEHVVFGHLGQANLHVNILPRNAGEHQVGKGLLRQWARQAVSMGGTVSAEHGIGKLKHALLEEMYGSEGIEQMRRLKRLFDPHGLLCSGNIFEP